MPTSHDRDHVMKHATTLLSACIIIFPGLARSPGTARAAEIGFDDRAAGNYPWYTYSQDPPITGVTFHTADIPDTIAIGTQFTAMNQNFTFDIDAGEGGLGYVSAPNFAKAAGGGTKDLLMSFPETITSLSLRLDTAPEGGPGEIVRLIVLKERGPATFEVLNFVEALDAEAGKLLRVGLGGPAFQWAVFQTLAEQEGIDNVSYQKLEPGDFNNDSVVNSLDIDLLFSAIDVGGPLIPFDVSGDGLVTLADLTYEVETILKTKFGDTDTDGDVDLADLGNMASGFGQPGEHRWARGNFNGDEDVDLNDLGTLATNYQGGKAAARLGNEC
jgi:hypothetical protein